MEGDTSPALPESAGLISPEDRLLDMTTRVMESINQNVVHHVMATRLTVEVEKKNHTVALEYERGWRTTRQSTLVSMREQLFQQLCLPKGKSFRFSRRIRSADRVIDVELAEISPNTIKDDDMIVVYEELDLNVNKSLGTIAEQGPEEKLDHVAVEAQEETVAELPLVEEEAFPTAADAENIDAI